MLSEAAILSDIYTVSPKMTVEDAMAFVRDKKVRAMPVVDGEGHLVGMFGLSATLKNLLPVAVTMEEGVQKLNFIVGAGAGIARRLLKEKKMLVEEVMTQDIVVGHPTTPLWEIVRLIVKYGSPLPIVEINSGKLLGIITEQSALDNIESILKTLQNSGTAEQQE
jgi:acetoin utilization protein AcuB